MNTKSIVKITRTIKHVVCVLKYCILTNIKKIQQYFKKYFKLNTKQSAKTTRTIKVYHLCEKFLILNHCKNTFNKSLIKNQKI